MIQLADLHDVHGQELLVADPVFRNYGGVSRFHGEIVTLRVDNDFLLIKQTLQQPGNGRVLVIDGGGSLRCALLGDKLAAMAAGNQWAGIVINGCVRDVADIADINIGVKALNTCPVKPSLEGNGEVGTALTFAGITFTQGAWLYADLDGLLVSDNYLTGSDTA